MSHWPFPELTPHQQRQIDALRDAMRERRLLRWPALVAGAVVCGALGACGGGGDADTQPDVPPPAVDCHVNPEACR